MDYFDKVTNARAVERQKLRNPQDLIQLSDLVAGSSWTSDELYAARLVIRSANVAGGYGYNHVLAVLRDYIDEAAGDHRAHDHPPIRKIVAGPDNPTAYYELTETEMVYRDCVSLGSFWAALARYRDTVGGDGTVEGDNEEDSMSVDEDEGDQSGGQKPPYSSSSSGSGISLPSPQSPTMQTKRVRRQTQHPKMFNISDSYIAALTNNNNTPGQMSDFLNLYATPWFDLSSQGGRRGAVDNLVALVQRQ